eukprot:scaffold4264_cov116-Isochrysis_galbana.AAC.17
MGPPPADAAPGDMQVEVERFQCHLVVVATSGAYSSNGCRPMSRVKRGPADGVIYLFNSAELRAVSLDLLEPLPQVGPLNCNVVRRSSRASSHEPMRRTQLLWMISAADENVILGYCV